MTNTHCLPSGALGAGELPVPNVSRTLMSILEPSPGSRRGVVVMMHGLTIPISPSVPTFDDVAGFQPILWATMANALLADGWVVIQPQVAENMYVGRPVDGLFADVSVDAGHGSRYLTQTLHWWDHVVAWIKANYGNWPIVPFGFSWGGWRAFQIAANRTSTIKAFVSHHGATLLSAVPSAITTPSDFTALNTTGLDTTSTMLNAVRIPGAIGWGTAPDPVVGFTAIKAIFDTAVAAGAPFVSNPQVTGHTLQSVDVTFYTDPSTGWFHTTADPLAPAVL